MINIGDIVFRKYKGGIRNNKPNESEVGLVIKELKEKGAVTQYCVSFNQKEPRWYFHHELYKIEWKGKKNVRS
tara:strand:- start:474 stop:692 length:219 start_codon:yes stop_codon:yes gene_type:complete